jgi:tRNA threonylcarbamoyladenosine biosynthesis protein TsaE
MDRCEFLSSSPAATLNLGKKIGEHLRAGSIIALTGELGCGKTLITRGICAGLGVPPRQVNSPTFVLVNEYRGRLPVLHMDLYRLGSIDDGFEIGIMDYFSRAASGVMIIEWAEKMASLLPTDVLNVEFEIISARKRRIVFSSTCDRFAGLFKELSR